MRTLIDALFSALAGATEEVAKEEKEKRPRRSPHYLGIFATLETHKMVEIVF